MLLKQGMQGVGFGTMLPFHTHHLHIATECSVWPELESVILGTRWDYFYWTSLKGQLVQHSVWMELSGKNDKDACVINGSLCLILNGTYVQGSCVCFKLRLFSQDFSYTQSQIEREGGGTLPGHTRAPLSPSPFPAITGQMSTSWPSSQQLPSLCVYSTQYPEVCGGSIVTILDNSYITTSPLWICLTPFLSQLS